MEVAKWHFFWYNGGMKHTYSIVQHTVSALAVFALTFSLGHTVGDSIVQRYDGDASVLQAAVGRTRASSASSAVRKPLRKKVQKRKFRGVLRELITRPRRQRIRESGEKVEEIDFRQRVPVKAHCGDSLVLLGEECDDGNAVSADGCSATCTIEEGFVCNVQKPNKCWATCPDGIKASVEKCDDGNSTNGDGCSSVCKIESGYKCTGSPSECDVIPYCGDAVVAGTEECDDANGTPGDGCHECKTE